MPRYMAIILDDPATAEADVPPEHWAKVMDEYNSFGAEAGAAGVIGGGEALQPPSTGTIVKVQGGKGGEIVTSDAALAEAKEVVGGFYLLDCKDLDEAISWAAKIPGAWYGRVEVRPVIDFSAA